MNNGWSMDPRALPNGTVLFVGVSYAEGDVQRALPGGDLRGRTAPKIYTYAALKQGGVWYFTGTGKVPQAAGWGAVERWLDRDNRHLEWVKISTGVADVYPVPEPVARPIRPGHPASIVTYDEPVPEETKPTEVVELQPEGNTWPGDLDDPPWNENTPYDADQSDYGPRYEV